MYSDKEKLSLKYLSKADDKTHTSLLGVHQLSFFCSFLYLADNSLICVSTLGFFLSPIGVLAQAAANSGMFILPDTTADFTYSFPSVISLFSGTDKMVLQTLERNKSKKMTKYQHLSVHIEILISQTLTEIDSCIQHILISICI